MSKPDVPYVCIDCGNVWVKGKYEARRCPECHSEVTRLKSMVEIVPLGNGRVIYLVGSDTTVLKDARVGVGDENGEKVVTVRLRK